MRFFSIFVFVFVLVGVIHSITPERYARGHVPWVPANIPTPNQWFGGVLHSWEILPNNHSETLAVLGNVISSIDLDADACNNADSFQRLVLQQHISVHHIRWTILLATKDGHVALTVFQYGSTIPVILGVIVAYELEYHGIVHSILISMDRSYRWHVYQHKTRSLDSQSLIQPASDLLLSVPFTTQALTNAEQLSLISFNIWNFGEHQPDSINSHNRIEKMLDAIRSHQPDIVAFQEVRYDHKFGRSGRASQLSQLHQGLPGYNYIFQPAMAYTEGFVGRVEEGLAVFSRYDIVEHSYILLPRNASDPDDFHQRICLRVRVLLPSKAASNNSIFLDVFVTHLSLSDTAQQRSAVAIWQFMRQSRHQARLAGHVLQQILLGDMNAEPTSSAIKFLQGEISLDSIRTKGLHDVWPHLHGDEPGFTFSSDAPVKRIDFIFSTLQSHDPQLPSNSSWNPISINLIRHNEGTAVLSDHFGLIARFAWH